MRDSQRSKVYAAENTLKKMSESFATFDDAKRFVDAAVASGWWKGNFPQIHRIEVHRGGVSWAWGGQHNWYPKTGWIKLPDNEFGRKKLVIIHEMAHCLAPRKSKHDRLYCNVYLKLVRHFLGSEAEQELKNAFKEKRVQYKLPRQLSPERKLQLREQGLALAAKRKEKQQTPQQEQQEEEQHCSSAC
jgi:putative metallohydrolase (TIGR04338 family)